MSRLKRPIQTARISARTHCADTCGPFKQKSNFREWDDAVAYSHALDGQALRQKGSIIFERPFEKKSGISLGGKLCGVNELEE
ncbi:hypothetical protein [Paraburkholderia strydomiana]|uniref:hypothetical protein n=1 Tax=Paraburkholderia strydomiana TaxID=1245417 RepID=UPI0038B9BFD4